MGITFEMTHVQGQGCWPQNCLISSGHWNLLTQSKAKTLLRLPFFRYLWANSFPNESDTFMKFSPINYIFGNSMIFTISVHQCRIFQVKTRVLLLQRSSSSKKKLTFNFTIVSVQIWAVNCQTQLIYNLQKMYFNTEDIISLLIAL